MSMPPAGVVGLMDEQAVIEAEIQLELENINLDDEVQLVDEPENELQADLEEELDVNNELESYIKRLQDQSSRFEQELLECDELLTHTSQKNDTLESALIPYEDHNLLLQLAKEQGCDVDQYKRKILEDIENDEVIIDDELADLIGNTTEEGEQYSITENGENGPVDAELPVKINKAVEEGIDYEDVPVSQELVLVNGERNTNAQLDMQKMLREQLDRLEYRYQEKIDRIKKDEAHKRNEEEVREKRTNEERQWKMQEIQRQEQQLLVEQELAEKKIKQEQELAEKEMQENMRKFQEEMSQLQADMDRQKREYDMSLEMERKRQEEKQEKAVLVIQRTYRGYRVRKDAQPLLTERREERKKEKEEQRIKEVEVEIQQRKEEQQEKEEQERKRQEEEKQQKEELKRQKEEEKKRLEEEKRRKKEEEERIKQEEKKRKEEEKQRKKEEEKKRKEEEKRKKEEEEQRKKEEKRLKEEEEKKRKEEEKRLKEEEKRKKEEEKRLKEEEKKKEKERQLEEERRKKEEIKMKEEMKNKTNTGNDEQSSKQNNEINEKLDIKDDTVSEQKSKDISEHSNNVSENSIQNSVKDTKPEAEVVKGDKILTEGENDKGAPADAETAEKDDEAMDKGAETNKVPKRPKTPRSARTPRTPRPHTPKTDKKESKNKEEKVEQKEVKADLLPDHLESLRLKFIKECIPWSKVSNEPWKLKAGVSRKPLRRPSSAKKMPLISEDVIIQAARVASLKMVTTVELKDLPGNNVSTLGQCGGLKYLTLTNCNLVAIDGLTQCRQLQYVNVQNNKIEYVDLKDAGQLQYLNISHNKLSSIHGLDNCTNLRWLDLSHNNVTRLGGMDTMRRLHTLKISHNQLISTQGLGATPTLQMVDISHNHLQAIEDLDKLCLLFSLDASSNNLLQIPSLHNQVLLIELLLSDNSISSLSVLAAVWLPLLASIQLQQNSISELSSLQNCLLLKELNLCENQIADPGSVQHCVEVCFYMEQLHLVDNPVVTDMNDSFFSKLKCSCPRLSSSLDLQSDTLARHTPVKPRTSFEAMCLTQLRTLKDVIGQFEHSLKLKENSPTDQSQFCDSHYKFCDRTFNIAVEYRYAHEYGEVTVPMPTAPTAPKSGRPLSSRQREKFMNPKEMFENALKSTSSGSQPVIIANEKETVNGNPKDLFENSLKMQNMGKESLNSDMSFSNKTDIGDVSFAQPSFTANPRDLFEQALKSADQSSNNTCTGTANKKDNLSNGHIQAHRGHQVHNEDLKQRKMAESATTIQAAWRGYRCRKQLIEQFQDQNVSGFDPAILDELNKCAVKIQASWRGYSLRKKLLAALEYAQCNFDDDDENDDDGMDFGDEFDLDKFVDIDEGLLDTDWKPPATPDIPTSYPVLKKPPSGKLRVPPLDAADLRPPSKPGRAWRNADSPMSDLAKVPRPPSSVASTELTFRSAVSKKEEKLAEEWGFKDSGTAYLMMQRAKKMKLNAERRNKIKKLDPKQRLALFRKLEEVTHPPTHTIPQRKTLPRKEYFQARQDEIVRQEREKRQEYNVKASRTFEWLHSQVGDHTVSDSVINQGLSEGPKYVPLSEKNLPELINGGKRVQLISSPMSMELQSMESASMAGQKQRRFSAGSGSGSGTSKLPPIQSSLAPSSAPHLKERMSFRNPKVNQSVGWGGGKKRGNLY